MEIQHAAEFGWLIAVFVLVSVIADFVKKQKARRQEEQELSRQAKTYTAVGSGTVTGAGDTQREGRTLEDLLRGLEQTLSGEEAPPRLPPPRPQGSVGASRGPARSYDNAPTRPRSSTPARRAPTLYGDRKSVV